MPMPIATPIPTPWMATIRVAVQGWPGNPLSSELVMGALIPAFSCSVLFHGIYNASDGIDVLCALTPENL